MKTNSVPLSGEATVVAKPQPPKPSATIVAINQSGRQRLGGASTLPTATRSNYALRDSLPAMTDAERSSAAGKFVIAFLSVCFLIPMICVGVMMGSR